MATETVQSGASAHCPIIPAPPAVLNNLSSWFFIVIAVVGTWAVLTKRIF